jgi:hypothetical protein
MMVTFGVENSRRGLPPSEARVPSMTICGVWAGLDGKKVKCMELTVSARPTKHFQKAVLDRTRRIVAQKTALTRRVFP